MVASRHGGAGAIRMNVMFKPKAGAAVSTSRRVGFRYFALATGNDTDTSLVEKEKNEQGSESHGIYFHCYPINMVGLYLKHMEQAGGIEHSTPWQSSARRCCTRASTRWLLHGPRGSRLPLPRGRAFRHRRRRRSLDQGGLAGPGRSAIAAHPCQIVRPHKALPGVAARHGYIPVLPWVRQGG